MRIRAGASSRLEMSDIETGDIIRNFKPLASFCGCTGQFESYLVETPEDRFSRDEAYIYICTKSEQQQSYYQQSSLC